MESIELSGNIAALDLPQPWRATTTAKEAARVTVLAVLGLALPWACHQIHTGAISPAVVLMPLMLPVVLGAFLLPLRSALLVAVGLPLLSFATSGMPPFSPPVAPEMIVEGVVTILAIQWVLVRGARPWWWAMAAGVAANRLTALLCDALVAQFWTHRPLGSVAAATAEGMVGLLVSWAVLPLLFRLYRAPRTR